MTTFTRETASSSIRACTEPSRYWFPRLHCYRASIQPTCHDDDDDVYDRRARMEDVSAAKVLRDGRSGHRKRGHVERESTERYWSLVSRCGEIYWKSYQPCPSRMVPLLLVERRDIYLNETFARDLLAYRFDLSVMWIFLFSSSFFFGFRNYGDSIGRLISFVKWFDWGEVFLESIYVIGLFSRFVNELK